MNYRHIYHAGNFADVFKHAVLTLIVGYLARKEKPFVLIDTHAGIGLYDLRSDEAQRTGEHRQGIDRLLAAPQLPEYLADYVGIVRALNEPDATNRYPGSPWIMRRMMRHCDRLDLAELHPADAGSLGALFAGERGVRVYEMDGYMMLKSFLPPRERRGLVLIDPPFEVTDELDRMFEGLTQACRRWATGVYVLWYPVKDAAAAAGFRAAIRAADRLPPILSAEFDIGPGGPGLRRCALAIVNPP